MKKYIVIKRFLDVFFSLIGVIGTSPFWLIAIIGIEISDPGPLFYVADRIGYKNKHFKMYKFRSMRVVHDADEKSFKADVSRVFAFGRFIRATKIDELPQLLNLIKGDMSIVGPRPAANDQFDIMRTGNMARLAEVKPGLTAHAAIYDYLYGEKITNEFEYVEKVLPVRQKLELHYVDDISFLTDMKLVVCTMVCVVMSIFGGGPKWILDWVTEQVKENEELQPAEKVGII